ncbi:MAG TPA: hypothetical protein VNY36_02550 [Bacteroidia bacterium]|jgi:hypothetical protein|nr:hypothetical protein [Bacteroidia bacterium]
MRYLLLILTACLTLSVNAQKVKLVNATSQSWSGGVAGHHGTNYAITIKCSDTAIKLDTLYTGGNCYAINIEKHDTLNRKVDKKTNTITYNIHAYDSYNDMDFGDPVKRHEREQERAKMPHRNYDGAALLIYRIKRVKYNFLIKSYTQLPALNHP